MTLLHSRTAAFLAFLFRRRSLFACGLALLLTACATRVPAPVEDRSVRPSSGRPVPGATVPASAAKPAPAPPTREADTRPQTYTVKRGDTLYLIALDHGLDYRELAAWNNVENVNVIRVGQVLRLAPPGEPAVTAAAEPGTGGVVTTPLRAVPPVVAGNSSVAPAPAPAAEPRAAAGPAPRQSEAYKSQPKALKEPYSEPALREMQRSAATSPPTAPVTAASPPSAAPSASADASAPPPTVANASPRLEPTRPAEAKPAPSKPPSAASGDDDDEKVDWVWPAQGKLVTGFSDTANLKGIDIAGAAGAPVLASAAGKVVYAGSGLRGYGKLIIIKHSKAYLSAYAHNREILVKEGQQVSRGQRIAEMGNTDSDQVKLHFEIRRLGKPMDPLKYLPPA